MTFLITAALGFVTCVGAVVGVSALAYGIGYLGSRLDPYCKTHEERFQLGFSTIGVLSVVVFVSYFIGLVITGGQ